MKKLKSLEEHNSLARKEQHFDWNKPMLNGISCPKCKEELFDSNPMITLTSYPSQKNVHCSNKECNYVGYRIA